MPITREQVNEVFMTVTGNTITFSNAEAQGFSMRLSDGLCFLAGLEFLKDDGLPEELRVMREVCRELNLALKEMDWS